MRRDSRLRLNLSRDRRGSSEAPVLFAVVCFALVLGAGYFFYRQQQAQAVAEAQMAAEMAQARRQQAVAERDAAARKKESLVDSAPSEAIVVTTGEVAQPSGESLNADEHTVATAADAELNPTPLDPAVPRRQTLAAQLAAGEIGPAIETAMSAPDEDERAQLLKQVAEAQMQVGDFDGARASTRRIPQREQRASTMRERTSRRMLAGGGTGADFGQLIELIQNETTGPWQDIEGTGGTVSEFETGVRVDPNGMLHRLTKTEQSGRLEALGIRARHADLNEDMARPSALRLVSLTRLEQEVAKRLAQGRSPLTTMQHLAGLQQVRYVFVFPEEGEIVIGGPAQAWRYDESGLPIGVENGSPTLQLDDLVTVLRTFSPDGLGIFNCLIVPREEGLKAIKEHVAQSNTRGPLRSTAVSRWVQTLQEKLGLQDVEINGVPAESRVARVIVEADYRMKLIGVGKLDGGKNMRSFFDLLDVKPTQEPPPLDALRWWLTMKYDAVLHSPDHSVFEIQGSSVLCRSENELITDDGKRVHTGKAEETNRLFAQLFTQHYAELAESDLVFADLQNIFDLALVAALLRHEGLDERAGWSGGVFASHGPYRPAVFEPPQTVMTVAAHRVYNGRDIVVQVAGGVRGDLMAVVRNSEVLRQTDRLAGASDRGRAPELPEGRWWWDAEE